MTGVGRGVRVSGEALECVPSADSEVAVRTVGRIVWQLTPRAWQWAEGRIEAREGTLEDVRRAFAFVEEES
jgi:hypothetical protein